MFAAMTMPQPARSASPAMTASCRATGPDASTTSTATSARAMARRATVTLTCSTCPLLATRPGRRMPAVSTSRSGWPCHVIRVSTASRVVPAVSLTSTRSGARQQVDERRLAHVRTADDRDPDLVRPVRPHRGRFHALAAGQPAHGFIEQVADPEAVLGRNGYQGRDAQGAELIDAPGRLPVVHLVDGQHHRYAGAPRAVGHLPIGGHEAVAAVDQQDDEVGGVERPEPLLRDRLLQRIGAGPEQPARVDQLERRAEPLGLGRDDVARRAGNRRHDGPPGPADPVEQRRFSDVGTSDEHDRSVTAHSGCWRHGGGRTRLARRLTPVNYSIYDA